MRSSTVAAALAVLPALVACRSADGRTAFVTRHEGGLATLEVPGLPSLVVPEGELPPPPRPVVVARDSAGARFAYPVARVPTEGDSPAPGPALIFGARIVHVIDGVPRRGGVLEGFDVDAPDFARAPSGTAAIADVVREGGETVLAELLARAPDASARERVVAAAPDVSGDGWDRAFEALPEDARARVRTGLLAALEPTGSPGALLRVARHVPLDAALSAKAAERISVLASRSVPPALRAQAELLRALSRSAPASAAKAACVALEAKLLARAGESMTRRAHALFDAPGRTALVKASLLVVAETRSPCAAASAHLGDDACLPELRCDARGVPLAPGAASRQDEPLCEGAALDGLVPAWGRSWSPDAPDASPSIPLLALAALARTSGIPAAVREAHARRRWPLRQPQAGPECDGTLPLGAACRCDEATVRDQACRHEPGAVAVGPCGFVVDPRAKVLRDVHAVAPP